MNLQDIMQFVRFSSLKTMPGGKGAIFQVNGVNHERKIFFKRFNYIDFDRHIISELPMLEGVSCVCPVNGKYPLAFVKGNDIYLGDPLHGQSVRIGAMQYVPRKLAASPDGAKLLFIAETPEEEDVLLRQRGIIIEGRQVPAQIFEVEIGTGKVRALTATVAAKGDAVWSPDGTEVVYTELTPEVEDLPFCAALKIINVRSLKEKILLDGAVRCSSPQWSPDGGNIAFLMRRPSAFRDDNLMVIPAEGGTVKNLTAGLDRRVTQFCWTGSRDLRFLLREGLFCNLWQASPGGKVKRLSHGERFLAGFDFLPGGERLLYTSSAAGQPEELYQAGLDGTRETRLTNLNAYFWNEQNCRTEILQWHNSAGQKIDGIWLRPLTAKPAKTPLISNNHGSTPGAFNIDYFPGARYWVDHGFSVLMANYRGSAGYGQDFMEAIFGCWCSGPAEDIVKGVETLIAAKAVDVKRIGITGASGGALMGAAAIGTSRIFKAAVLQCGWYDFAGLYKEDWKNIFRSVMGGSPLENPALYQKESPLTYVSKVKIPVLLLCGENDTAAPMVQSELYYSCLRGNNTIVDLVRYQGEGHALTQYDHIADCSVRTMEWFKKYFN